MPPTHFAAPSETMITIGPVIIIGEIRSKMSLGASNDDQAPTPDPVLSKCFADEGDEGIMPA
jgi:hypothetical protein